MPTEKPRVMLSVEPETHAALQRFSVASGKPMATFIAELLDTSLPLIQQLADAAEAAKDQRAEALDMLLKPFAQTQIENGQMQLKLYDERIRAAKKARKKVAAGLAATGVKGPRLVGKKPRVHR